MYSASTSFADLGLDARLVAGLRETHITTPTAIQAQSIPAILARRNVLCTAQTGTGKTLAYLAPVIEQILRADTAAANGPHAVVQQRPRALVLLPSRELALQVAAVAIVVGAILYFLSRPRPVGTP